MKIPKGTIKRLSASILLDEEVRWQGTGSHAKRIVTPPDPEKLKAIHDIVAGVIGLSPTRGDQLIVESLPFQQSWESEPAAPETPAKPATPQDQLRKLVSNPKAMIGIGGGVICVLAIAIFGLKVRRKKLAASLRTAASLPAPGTPADEASRKEIAAVQDARLQAPETTQKALEMPDIAAQVETLRQNVRESVSRDPALAAGVIRTWIAEAEA